MRDLTEQERVAACRVRSASTPLTCCSRQRNKSGRTRPGRMTWRAPCPKQRKIDEADTRARSTLAGEDYNWASLVS